MKAQFINERLDVIAAWFNESNPDKTITVADSIGANQFSGVLELDKPELLAALLSCDGTYRITQHEKGFTIALATH